VSASQAIVTLAVGHEYAERWHRLCERNWRRYAERHGYDLICIEEPLDHSERARGRSPSWQKLLVLGQPFAEDYERIVWIDADILFGYEAPSVADGVPPELVGAVDEHDLPTPALRHALYPEGLAEYYAAVGLSASFEQIVQTGLMVLCPQHHRELFEHVYTSYEDPGPGLYYEMRPLSWELLRNDRVWWLDARFNRLWDIYRAHQYPFLFDHPGHPRAADAVEQALREAYCLHFAGINADMDHFLDTAARARVGSRRRAIRAVERARTPVVMSLFARPDTTKRVLDVVRQVEPARLLVVANAPRPEVAGETARCDATRALIDDVDWDCEISTDYAEHHMSQKRRIETGLDWAFSLTEEAIVLEDDCVPDPSLFPFCDALLERHRDEETVMSISGDNFQFDGPASEDSYYFSRYPHTWGWATWRRAWARYDHAMSRWPDLRESGWLQEVVEGPHAVAYWSHLFDQNYLEHDAWNWAWLFACWLNEGIHALPNVNLVTKMGSRNAPHTPPAQRGLLSELPSKAMPFPLKHPAELTRNAQADSFTERVVFSGVVGQIFDRIRATRRVGIAS
jgi:hypothetical protein